MKLYHLLYLVLIAAIALIILPIDLPLPGSMNCAAAATFSALGDGISLANPGIAASCYGYALSFNASDPALYHKKGGAYMEIGEYEGAMLAFEQASLLDQANPAYPFGKARAQLLAGDSSGAEETLSALLIRSPDHPGALTNRAAALLSQGRYEEAIQDLDALIEAYPEDASARIHRGDAYMHIMMQHEAGLREMRGVETMFSDGTTHSLAASNAYQKASRDYMKAMELNPMLTPVVMARMMAQYESQIETYGIILQSL